jgi:hypothetical protein
MKQLLLLGLLGLVAASCGGAKHRVVVAPEPPPPQSSWPPYPRFPARSCWTRPTGAGMVGYAPSFAPPRRSRAITPPVVVRRLRERFGDPKLAISLAGPARNRLSHVRGDFAGRRPPHDAVWAWIHVRGETVLRAQWESNLVGGALRDDLCAAGGSPLVGWTADGGGGFSDDYQPFGQRFPNPSPAAYRRRVELIGRAYGFRVVSLRLLRPLQLAPAVVVATDRPRREFAHDAAKIIKLLNPGRGQATTFEGLYLEARDRHGAFMRNESISRGQAEGGEWAWDQCYMAFPTLGRAVGAKPCPRDATSG